MSLNFRGGIQIDFKYLQKRKHFKIIVFWGYYLISGEENDQTPLYSEHSKMRRKRNRICSRGSILIIKKLEGINEQAFQGMDYVV